MKKVKFISAEVAKSQINGVSVEFEIEYSKENQGFLKDEKNQVLFRATFTTFVLLRWQLTEGLTNEKIIKLAFPFVVQWVTAKVKDGTLKEYEEQLVTIEDNYISYPFDINKIDKIIGYEIEFPVQEPPISIRIEQSILANDIIVLRDNINVLIHSKNGDILFKLGQERNILYLFRQVDSVEQFTYAIATLANLVTDLNIELLRKLTKTADKEIKTIDLLEIFLNNIDSDNKEIVDTFRTINRMRQGFPIHTDKAGIVKTMKKFNIDYPDFTYDTTWHQILEKYKNALSLMMGKIKKYAA